MTDQHAGFLSHLLVIELASELTEWCGRCFVDAGARVILIEPRGGAPSRGLAPRVVSADNQHSLHFWFYNPGKESIELDLSSERDRRQLLDVVSRAHILIEGYGRDRLLGDFAISDSILSEANPDLIHVSITDFGQDGPWQHYRASDITHLALGGQVMMCGYDDAPESPPIAPAGGQAYHMAGSVAFLGALAALQAPAPEGGHFVDIAVHDVCASMTERALPHYDYEGKIVSRRTGRHADTRPTPRWQYPAADGRYVNALLYHVNADTWTSLVEWLDSKGMAEDLTDPMYYLTDYWQERQFHIYEVLARFIATMPAKELFHEGQKRGLILSDINEPMDLVWDPHLCARGFFRDIQHDELGMVRFPGSSIVASCGFVGPRRRAPRLNEHRDVLRRESQQMEGAWSDR